MADATHVALSSLELSALRIAAFDPDAIASIRGGARVNYVDDDDSGMLVHAVALCDYPEPLWAAIAPAFLGQDRRFGGLASLADFRTARAVPDPAHMPRFIALAPAELEAALATDHPDALADGTAIGARIHCLHRIRWSTAPIAWLAPGELSEAAWRAAAGTIPQPGGARWTPTLLLRRQSVPHDPAIGRAVTLLRECHAALHVVREAPFDAGQDFDTYHADLMRQVMADGHALGILRADPDGDIAIVTTALDAAGHGWRTFDPVIAPMAA